MANALKSWILVASVMFLTSGVATAQDRWYVDDDAPPGGDGTSWATAFSHLQDGLAATAGNDVIWVAAGTYAPDQGAGQAPGDREATFQLINGVALYGGFVGDEDPVTFDLNTRDFTANETTLTGDLSNDDEPGFGNNGENSYHVVTGSDTDATATTDGFTIAGGNADGLFQQNRDRGGGMYNAYGRPTLANCTFSLNTSAGTHPSSGGGGMYNRFSSPTLTNCRISGNTANNEGGGIRNYGSYPTLTNCIISGNTAYDGGGMHNHGSSPTLTNCTFSENTSNNNGGGLRNDSFSSPTLTNCTFRMNAAGSGGGMANARNSSPTVTDCVFSRNNAGNGGGMHNDDDSDPALTRCTFSRNTGYNGGGMYNTYDTRPTLAGCVFSGNTGYSGGGMYNTVSSASPLLANCTLIGNIAVSTGGGMSYGNPTATNCVFWGNRDSGGSDESTQIHGGSPTVNYSCIQGLDTLAGVGNTGDDPLLTGGGVHLQSGSPCIDAGDPLGDYADQTDIDSEPREIGDHVDMGADEFLDTDGDALPDWWEQVHFDSTTAGVASADPDNDGRDTLAEYEGDTDPVSPPRTYYVARTGDDGWDGLSPAWDGEHGPKATIQAGIDVAHPYEGDVVLVAPGTYTGAGNRDLEFFGKAIVLRGNDPDDPETVSATVIDCQGTIEDEHRAFRFRSMEGPDSVVAGFTITGGYVSGGYAAGGGAVNCLFSSPMIANCTFSGNTASHDGGAVFNHESNPTLTHCMFNGNAATGGGGMYNVERSSPTLTRCAFVGNTARAGGGVFNDDSSPTLTHCIFSGNVATGSVFSAGGGMYNEYSSSPALTNCTVAGNTAVGVASAGGGIHNRFVSDPTVTNCIVWGNNDAAGSDESAQIDGGSPSVTYSCIQGLSSLNGEGNMGDDPGFVDDYGDLRLTGGSPCVDAGDPGVVLEPGVVDLDGHARVLCGRVDMGAFEFGIGSFECDGEVDLVDWGQLQACFVGEDAGAYGDGCEAFDFEFDGDVDLCDFAAFEELVGG